MRFSKYSRWQPKKQEREEPKQPEKRQTLDEFLTGVLIDVCRSRPSGASISWEYTHIGNPTDGSKRYKQYRRDVDYRSGATRGQHFSEDVLLDPNEQPHDISNYIIGVLAEHNIPSERQGSRILMDVRLLRQHENAGKIADMLTAGADKPVSTADVVNAYRRIHGREPVGMCMGAYELFEVGEALMLSDEEILRRFRKFNTKR